MVKIIFGVFFFFCLNLIFLTSANAQVVINEFSSDTSSDWVEIYNASGADIDLSLYRLRDTSETNKKDLSGILANGQVVAFDFSDSLNRSGDTVKLYLMENAQEKTLVDSISYGGNTNLCLPSSSGSIGRAPDANSTIERFSVHTRGAFNGTMNLEPCPTPSPSATPTPTPTPTSTPSSTPTVKPTTTPKASATPTPKISSTPSPKASSSPSSLGSTNSTADQNAVLGLREGLIEEDDEAASTSAKVSEGKNFPVLAAIFVLGGVGVLGFGGFTFLKQSKVGYTEGRDKSKHKN